MLRQPETLPQLVAPDALSRLAAAVLAARAAGAARGGAESGGGSSSAASGAGPAAATAAAAGAGQLAAAAGGASAAEPSLELQQQLLARLQRDVEACVMCDRIYSPASGELAGYWEGVSGAGRQSWERHAWAASGLRPAGIPWPRTL